MRTLWDEEGAEIKNEVMPMLMFWVVKPRELAPKNQRFEGTYCLHLQDWVCIHLSPHGITIL
jgi:hypothetical protein